MPEKMNLRVATENLQQPDSVRKLKNESMVAGEETRALMGKRPRIELCLDECIKWITAQEFEPYIQKELIKSVSKYPHSALLSFMRSIPQQVSRITKAKRERDGVLRKRKENKQEEISVAPVESMKSDDLGDPFGPP